MIEIIGTSDLGNNEGKIVYDGKIKGNQRYPNKELIIRKDNTLPKIMIGDYNTGGYAEDNYVAMNFTYESDADIIELIFKGKYLKSLGKEVDVYIKYLPYSRLDRVEDDVGFTLKYLADLINTVGFDRVIIEEPHSDVCLALINNAVPASLMRLMLDRLKFDRVITDSSYLMFPDTTAFKRYEKMLPNRYFLGLKNRDFKTGKITSYRLVPPEGQLDPRQAVFIVDDLCAKGTTALNAGLELKKLGFQNIYLVVPHCEDTVFDGELLKDDSPVKLIYTKGTMIRPEHPKIKVI